MRTVWIGTFRATNGITQATFCGIRLCLPEGAPAEFISAEWPQGSEPALDDETPPADVIEWIARKWDADTAGDDRERKSSLIAWCRGNSAMIDRVWAETQIQRAQKKIADSLQLIADLTRRHLPK